jgi:hypothetical protein
VPGGQVDELVQGRITELAPPVIVAGRCCVSRR